LIGMTNHVGTGRTDVTTRIIHVCSAPFDPYVIADPIGTYVACFVACLTARLPPPRRLVGQ